MRLLLLGGSWFLGRAVVDAALAAGWEVTTFRRGRTGHQGGVRLVQGDRTEPADLARLATHGPWDAIVDTMSYVPRESLAMARILETVADRYVLVSTVSVYEGWPVEPLTEHSPTLKCPPDADADYGVDADPGPSRYGFGKAGCECAVTSAFGPARVAILRPGVILGPHEYVGRLPWWLRRFERGGTVIGPGDPARRIQPVDVRDVAKFALRCALGLQGVYNVVGLDEEATMGEFLAACAEVTGSAAEVEWVPDEHLIKSGVKHWTEIPLWRPFAGTWDISASAAERAGLTTRPLAETVHDTWEWLQNAEPMAHERAAELGITPERESTILEAWRAQRP